MPDKPETFIDLSFRPAVEWQAGCLPHPVGCHDSVGIDDSRSKQLAKDLSDPRTVLPVIAWRAAESDGGDRLRWNVGLLRQAWLIGKSRQWDRNVIPNLVLFPRLRSRVRSPAAAWASVLPGPFQRPSDHHTALTASRLSALRMSCDASPE